jgi:hypothetical protein
MPRPVLILAIAVVVLIVLLFGLAALDREVPVSHVERPLSNAAAQ